MAMQAGVPVVPIVMRNAGDIMRPSRFKSFEKAVAFIDTLPVIEAPATPVAEEESEENDLDVQPESRDAA